MLEVDQMGAFRAGGFHGLLAWFNLVEEFGFQGAKQRSEQNAPKAGGHGAGNALANQGGVTADAVHHHDDNADDRVCHAAEKNEAGAGLANEQVDA